MIKNIAKFIIIIIISINLSSCSTIGLGMLLYSGKGDITAGGQGGGVIMLMATVTDIALGSKSTIGKIFTGSAYVGLSFWALMFVGAMYEVVSDQIKKNDQ
jgi:hypothetical protein